MSRGYQVGKARVLTRAHVYGGGATNYAWDPDPHYGTHTIIISAKRAYIEAIWPELKGAPDAYISRFWDGEPKQLHKAKIVKVPKVERNGAEKLYHGSNEDWLEELDGNEPGYTGSLGWGLYLTTDPDFAAKFGKHIYEVESPVPDELVAQIEPMSYDCGNDLTFYTPGSTPFTFEIEDRKTGKTHRYSVLGDCEEEVRQDLRRWALGEFVPSQELKDDVSKLPPAIASRVGVGAKEILDAAGKEERVDDVIDAILDTMSEEGVDGDLLDDEVKPLLEALEREIDEFADAKVAERLGDEIDLDDISATVSHHGYSAFFISDYAPGDEYVIVDEKYLPIPVTK